ncbi:calcium/sodium antiporter [Acuticoccus mangrovi]|uniref:Calcium/sodium antiporter n=1 Tax=Acuticoccus mangrovi TaxID=2796142 RepID=A0A934IRE2_9HYPH|nr:calcium/sodium antiporter [Acuticoccus mangrovi]MBJ3776872.1 calcium/sodium antiporter [Acuticoccus mangrovi]
MPLLTLFIGLALLLAGGEALVRGSVAVATRVGVSPLVIGLTLVGFGTSAPELVASVQAAWIGAPGIAVGNIVGSNIANILLILGVSAVILPVVASGQMLRRDGTMLIVVSVVLVVIVLSGTLDRWSGVCLIAALAVYTIGSFVFEMRGNGDVVPEEPSCWPRNLWTALAISLVGIGGVVLGADLLVDAAIEIAEIAGISQAIIGLTIVSIGTSLPELATSVMAAIRRQGDVALGNVVGSNIFNVLGIGGVTAVVSPIPVPPEIIHLDVWVMLASALLLVAVAAVTGGIGRRAGALLVALYGGYLVLEFSPGVRAAAGL